MTWEYVAGFFDGEGCVSFNVNHKRKRPPFYRISIHNTHRPTINKLLRFIRSHSIRCALVITSHRNPKWKTSYTITVNDAASMLNFIAGVRPFAVTKVKRLDDAFRWGQRIDKRPRRRPSELRHAMAEYRRGWSLNQVAARTGVPATTLHHYAKRSGFKMRSLSAGQRLSKSGFRPDA